MARVRTGWVTRHLRIAVAIIAAALALAGLIWGGRLYLASDAGRGAVVRLLGLYAPKSGLRVGVGRIEGDILGHARLHDLTLADPEGVFARVPLLDLDWRPLALVENRLSVRSAVAGEAVVLRRPRLRPSADKRILPSIDIVVDRLRIDRLVLAAPVTGIAETIALGGSADIRKGRAQVDAAATSATGGDAVRVHLDAVPDRDALELAATIAAPVHGTIARLAGLTTAFDLAIGGKGTWQDWHGSAVARLGKVRLADLVLAANSGRFVVTGTTVPSSMFGGGLARVTTPFVRVRADVRLADRVLSGSLAAASPVIAATATGSADFGSERFDALRVTARLLKPQAFLPRLTGRDITLDATVGNTFATPVVDYVLKSPSFAWGSTGFTNFRATGRATGRLIPVVATAARVENVGEDIAPLLANLRIAGPLSVAHGQVTSPALAVQSARIAGTMTLRLGLGDGDYAVGFDGRLPHYRVGEIGVADVAAQVRVAPDASGGTRVIGTVRAVATQIDGGFFRSIFAGLPVVTTAIDVAPDLSMRFTGLRLVAPGFQQAGSGTRAPDGSVHLITSGASRTYGATTVDLAGQLESPVVDIGLAAPGFGLTAVAAHAVEAPDGWRIVVRGGSAVGAATANALVRTGGTAIDVDAAAAGITVRGTLVPDTDALVAGRLAVGGAGLSGSLVLAPAGPAQRGDLVLAATGAKLGGVAIGRGTLTARIVAGSGEPSIDAKFALGDVRSAGLTLASLSGTIADTAGRGTATLALAGVAGVPFNATLDARGSSEHLDIGAAATVDGHKLTLDHRAIVDRAGAAWRLAPVVVQTPDGRVELAGSAGGGFSGSVRLDGLGLSLLTLFDPGYNFSGRASGTIAFAASATAAPTGSLALRIAGLSRAGLASSSQPIDLAINAALSATSASARAVVVRGAATLGRAQAELTLGGEANLHDRLLAAPLFAQARFSGPAEAVWLLGGVEALDVRGPITAAVDAGGRLGDPRLTGSIAVTGGRVENVALGTVVDNVKLDGRFNGSRLDLTAFSGTVGKDGKISGSGGVDLSAERGFPVDVTAKLEDAQILNRDDLRATASGTLRLRSDGGGGKITGALDIVRARYRFGRGGTTSDIPVVAVTERNLELLGRAPPRVVKPTLWSLDIAASARDNVDVAGLGLTSTWRGDLKLKGRATAPEFSGAVKMVRGDYDFAGKRFNLTRGDVRFDGKNPPDPVIDIAAENTSSGFTAQLSLTGTALHPDIKFSSTPALPEDEVLSRVLFGTSITTLSAPEAVQLAGALASLRGGKGGKLDPFNAVRKTLRIDRLRVLPADIATGRKTSIAAGEYIGRRLYVELSTDAQGYSASAIEVALTRSLSILSDVATLGGTSVNLRLKRDY
ncbi:MAG: translocation/assembly module TamB domain-containing protein [Janthinobacterium lividum]